MVITRLEYDLIAYLEYGDEYEGCYPMNKYCEKCGSLMVTKTGKYGKFRGCSAYPRCDWTEDYEEYGDILDNLVTEEE